MRIQQRTGPALGARSSGLFSAILRSAFGVVAMLAAASAQAQALRVTAANSSNNAVYDVTFVGSGGSTTKLNTDQSVHGSFRSLVYVPNESTGKIDLLVADTSRGEILRYDGATGAATVVWSAVAGPGPRCPDGLSVDAYGNLFAVTSGGDHEEAAAVWVLPRDPALPKGAGYLAPRLVDDQFGGVEIEHLKDSLVSGMTGAAAGLGDLLVLASDPRRVLVYSAASIQTVLNGSGPVSPSRTLISPAQFPSDCDLGGMAFWPPDGSLLVTAGGGTILRYSFTATTATRLSDFASGLGKGLSKVKTGLQSGAPYAFVTQTKLGQILKFGAPAALGGSNPPLATVTSGVNKPIGLAVSNLAAVSASTCLDSAGGCDLLGGVIKHNVKGVLTLSGFVIEDVCVVQVDPRIAQYGTCTGHSLPVSQVCGDYGSTVIPDYLCGGSGSSGSGFALVKSATNTLNTTKGTLVSSEVFPESLLSGGNAPCPQTVMGWAPLAGEGTVVEGTNMLELTGACGSSKGLSRGLSLWGVGLVLNQSALPGTTTTAQLVNFASSKYDALIGTVAQATIERVFRASLTACICTSQKYFKYKKYINAAAQLITCDSLVATHESKFFSSLTNPNPSGEIRGRFANLYLSINTRILGNQPASNWPLLP